MNNTTVRSNGVERGLISVIMPCYNAAPFLTEAVDCVLNQTYPHVELIVIDDGSTDGSRDLLRDFGDRIKLLTQDNMGPYPARNLGLAIARGEFVAFLDADDWWNLDALEKLHAALVGSDSDIAYCGWQNVGEVMQGEPYVPPEYENEDAVAHFVRTCPWPIHAALVRRDLVNRLGGFTTQRYSSMDYDFWLRALGEQARITRVDEVMAFYRWHGSGQISAVKSRQVLDALFAQQEFIRENPMLVKHLDKKLLFELTEGQVLRQAYRAFWKRDLVSAQKLFRHSAKARSFKLTDIRHVITAFLPGSTYRWVVEKIEKKRAGA